MPHRRGHQSNAHPVNRISPEITPLIIIDETCLCDVCARRTRAQFGHLLQGQLDEWSAQIDKLKAKADSAEGDAQLEYYKQIEELRSMQEAANNKLGELKEAGDEAWEDLKAGMDSAWDSLSSAIKPAASRFS